MKTDADNFRESSIKDIIHGLNKNGIEIIVYEPTLKEDEWNSYKIVNNLDNFKLLSDLIIANRFDEILDDVKNKVFTRDIYRID
jgi:UDPglucose 6-dehydrogenase